MARELCIDPADEFSGVTGVQPAEEMFDVVDASDRVLDQRPRSDVHRLGLRHRAVHVFLFRSDGHLLIHQRSPTKEEFPSVWTSSASGHVSAGETYDECVPRELFEELGVTAELTRLQKFDAGPHTSNEFTMLYQAHSDQPICFDPVEMSEIRWIKPDDLSEWIQAKPEQFSPAFILLIRWWFAARDSHRLPPSLDG